MISLPFFDPYMKEKFVFCTIVLIFITKNLLATRSIELILQGKAALAINNTRLYEDSSYLKPTLINIQENELVEWLASSTLEFPDNAQNQLFKWHKIRTLSGKTGWVFGDELALPTPISRIENKFRPLIHQKKNIGVSFESAIIWFASIEGKDIKKGKSYFNPIYKESYIIFSNDIGKSFSINYANASESGKSEIIQLWIEDFTKDGSNEVIWEKKYESSDSKQPDKTIEIFSVIAGNLQKIWEENMIRTDTNSVSKNKYILNNGTIRFLGVSLSNSPSFLLSEKNKLSNLQNTKHIESSSYTLKWNPLSKKLDTLYSKTTFTPRAEILQLTQLLSKPNPISNKISILSPPEKCTLLEYLENQNDSWFYIRTNSGNYGFVPTSAFSNIVIQNYLGAKDTLEIIVE